MLQIESNKDLLATLYVLLNLTEELIPEIVGELLFSTDKIGYSFHSYAQINKVFKRQRALWIKMYIDIHILLFNGVMEKVDVFNLQNITFFS